LFPPELLAAAGLAVIGGVIRGFTGFGTPLFLAPTYAVLFGPAATVPLIILQEIGATLLTIRDAWPRADRQEMSGFLLGCIPMMPIGAALLGILDPNLVKKVMSFITLAFVAALWSGWRYRGPRTAPVRVGLGALSGLTTGLAGIGGPPVVLYHVSGDKDPAAIRGNLVVYFSILTVVIVPVFAYRGLVTVETLWRCVVVTPPLLLGVAVGMRLFHGATERRYVNAALLVLLTGAVIGLIG
jgi:uncharacterized protein